MKLKELQGMLLGIVGDLHANKKQPHPPESKRWVVAVLLSAPK